MITIENFRRRICIFLSCVMLVSSFFAACVSAADVNNPYTLIDGGCVKNIDMHTNKRITGDVSYFTANVSSHIQGELTRDEIGYEVFGAIGSKKTRMFVYSKGADGDLDYANNTVLSIVEQFERDNPAWDAVAAVNGDFFDIETKLTASLGEPEGPMIQNGSLYRGYFQFVSGRGIVGVKSDGSMVYHTTGEGYEKNGYGIGYGVSDKYLDVAVSDKDTGERIADYTACFGATFNKNKLYLSTVDSGERDLSGRTVYVIKCKTYRHSHVPGGGIEGGTLGNYVLGEVVDIREGKENDKADQGYAFISAPKNINAKKMQVGTIVECEQQLDGEWKDVTNAIGVKQQILAEGNVLLKNCYGTYNTKGNLEESLVWTADIYDYPHCWKNRTVLGFMADNTPVLLVAARSSHEGAYKNLGASYYEMGEQLKALGCVNGFLLDGGGSSTFVIRNADGTFSNAFVGEGNGRAVGNAVILAVRDKSVPLPEDEKTSEVTTATQTTVSVTTEAVANVTTISENADKKSSIAPIFVAAATLTVAAATVITVTVVRKRRK